MKRILAVAIGPNTDTLITSSNPSNVRPYVTGLIGGLTKQIGTDYDIWYRERPRGNISGAFGPGTDNKPNNLIFPMSTFVLHEAASANTSIPIVSPTGSDPVADAVPLGTNVAVINAQRSQKADLCFDYFKQSVPNLSTVYFLHAKGYGPSERARSLVEPEATRKHVTLHRLEVTEATLATQLGGLPSGSVSNPTVGVLVLPIDFCIGEAPTQAPAIIQAAQGKNLPTFFPIPDWVTRTMPPMAFGAYGVSQSNCGSLAANLVEQILWHGASPATFGIQFAPANVFEWVVNQTVANRLNIPLVRVI
jgi:ABC-type uncharacterized transport system substrate-binding protein